MSKDTEIRIVPLDALPHGLAKRIQALIEEGSACPVAATAIVQAAGNLIGQHAVKHPGVSIDAQVDTYVRQIAQVAFDMATKGKGH